MTLLAVLWAILGIPIILGGAALIFDAARRVSGADLALGLLPCLFIIAFGLLYAMSGIGILMKTPWGYKAAKVTCYTMLIKIPFGTLIGFLSLRHLSTNAEYYKGKGA
jgi:hypothetical protein